MVTRIVVLETKTRRYVLGGNAVENRCSNKRNSAKTRPVIPEL